MRKTVFWDKVEIRIIAIIIFATVLTGASVFYTVYSLTYEAMMNEIRARAEVAHKHSETFIDLKSFYELEEKSDETKEFYFKTQQHLNNIRKVANIKYLYTAKKNASGKYIYLIDGLDLDDKDFRHVGDLIEVEIIAKLEECLLGRTVYADDIIDTEWGEIFVTYWPVYDEDTVVGVIGMEFDAAVIHRSWENAKKYSLIISAAIMIICVIVSYFLFKKVSYSFLKKLAYTDYLTGLKNRTAFELDLKMYDFDNESKEKLLIAVFDLNDLKFMNDNFGHLSGDIYLKKVANEINFVLLEAGENYRIGGDEFASLIIGTNEDVIMKKLEMISERIMSEDIRGVTGCGVSYGLAMYDKTVDSSLKDTFNRADNNMYQFKKNFKSKLSNTNARD